MRLSAKAIKNFSNVNSFDYANEWTVRAGEQNILYFQLVDLDQADLRYMAGVGVSNQPAGVTVTFPSIDDLQVINATAVQEADDKSIWKVTLNANQKPNSGNVAFAVFEGSNTRRFNVLQMIAVEYPQNDGSC